MVDCPSHTHPTQSRQHPGPLMTHTRPCTPCPPCTRLVVPERLSLTRHICRKATATTSSTSPSKVRVPTLNTQHWSTGVLRHPLAHARGVKEGHSRHPVSPRRVFLRASCTLSRPPTAAPATRVLARCQVPAGDACCARRAQRIKDTEGRHRTAAQTQHSQKAHLPLLDKGADLVGGHVHAVEVAQAALARDILHPPALVSARARNFLSSHQPPPHPACCQQRAARMRGGGG